MPTAQQSILTALKLYPDKTEFQPPPDEYVHPEIPIEFDPYIKTWIPVIPIELPHRLIPNELPYPLVRPMRFPLRIKIVVGGKEIELPIQLQISRAKV